MKKLFPIIAIVLLLFSVLSCDSGLKRVEDGNVNYYIYPYLKFTLSSDRTYFIASVVEGAKLTTVSVPGFVHTDFGAMPVKEFAGFEDINDSINLEEVILDVHIERVSDGAFDKAENLKVVKTSGDKEGPKWAHLPELKKDGYHFLGWKAGDTYVFNGMAIDPENNEAVPVFEAHDYAMYPGKEPTCTEGGYEPYGTCKVCGHSTYTELPALGHNIVHREEVPASCTESGVRDHYECTRCHLLFSDEKGENIITDIIIPAAGHKLTHIEGKDPTCQTEGVTEHYYCEICKGTYSDREGLYPLSTTVIDKVDHQPVDEWSSNSEHHWKKCKWCSYEFNKAEHDFDDGVITKSATLHTKGEKKFTCNTCAYVKLVDIPEHDHVAGETKVIAPTCFSEGYTLETCAKEECGEVIKKNIVPALTHHGTEYERLEPTCMAEGHIAYYHCDVCGYNFESQLSKVILASVKLDKVSHKAGTALYHDKDNHWNLCVYGCGTKMNITSHTYDRMVTESQYKVSDKNCTDPDIYHYSCVCSKAGNTTFEYGEPLGHTITHHAAKASTCTVQGNIEYWSCSVCKKNFSDKDGKNEITGSVLLPLADHSWDEGYQADSTHHWHLCTVCGTSSDKVVHTRIYGADETHHWHKCSVCEYRMSEKEAHNFVMQGETRYCTECGKVVERTDSEPGFDVDPVYPAPTGEISTSFDAETGKWTFTLRSTSSGSVPTDWTWYVDDALQTGEGLSTFEFVPPRQESYVIMCIFWNSSGYGSASTTIN